MPVSYAMRVCAFTVLTLIVQVPAWSASCRLRVPVCLMHRMWRLLAPYPQHVCVVPLCLPLPVWRQVLADSDKIDRLTLLGNQAVLSLSSGGKLLRLWDIHEGGLFWEAQLFSSTAAAQDWANSCDLVLLQDMDGDSQEDVLVLSGGALRLLSGINGAMLWETDLVAHGGDAASLRRVYADPAKPLEALVVGYLAPAKMSSSKAGHATATSSPPSSTSRGLVAITLELSQEAGSVVSSLEVTSPVPLSPSQPLHLVRATPGGSTDKASSTGASAVPRPYLPLAAVTLDADGTSLVVLSAPIWGGIGPRAVRPRTLSAHALQPLILAHGGDASALLASGTTTEGAGSEAAARDGSLFYLPMVAMQGGVWVGVGHPWDSRGLAMVALESSLAPAGAESAQEKHRAAVDVKPRAAQLVARRGCAVADEVASPEGGQNVVGALCMAAGAPPCLDVFKSPSLLAGVPAGSQDAAPVHAECFDQLAAEAGVRGAASRAWLQPFVRKSKGVGYRAMLSATDLSLVLLQQGKARWSREEALSGVVETRFFDLPPDGATLAVSKARHSVGSGANDDDPQAAIRDWLFGHLLRLKDTLGISSDEDVAALAALRATDPQKVSLERDPRGFRKLVVALTRCGKLLALHTGDGSILWTSFYGLGSPFSSKAPVATSHPTGSSAPSPPFTSLLTSRAHSMDEGVPPEVVLFGPGYGSPTAIWVNAYTGEETRAAPLPLCDPVGSPSGAQDGAATARGASSVRCDAVYQLPLLDASDAHLIMVVARGSSNKGTKGKSVPSAPPPQVIILPPTPEAYALAASAAPSLYFYNVDATAGFVTGHRVLAPADASNTGGGSNATSGGSKGGGVHSKTTSTAPSGTEEVWRLSFPPAVERIAAWAARPADVPVHSQVQPVGTHDVLFKYLNPNTLFVATETVPEAEGAAAGAEAHLSAFLLDTVTGRLLHRVTHASAQGPVHAVFCDNWVVYSFWNVRANRREVSVLEMYDAAADTADATSTGEGAESALSSTLGWLGGRGNTEPQTSFAIPPLKVIGQSFFLPVGVKLLSVTTTSKGITPKHVLIGTVADQVLAMDKRFLDPRRPYAATPEDREAGLVPYSEELPFIPPMFVTHREQVAKLRHVVTAPARLESASHVLAYGLDLFYTRTSPSKSYDLVSDDFNYALLVVTIVLLLVAAYVTSRAAHARILARKWY
eukprot:jgi/Mesvir1/1036/Mv17562-RA.3